jgi:hypothetical protein
MNPLIQLKTITPPLLITLTLLCFGLMPKVQAVGPDTEGNIPGANNGEGVGVLVNRTTGTWNTGDGFAALNHLTSGIYNTALGGQALFSVTGGGYNTAVGLNALYHNTGNFNTATGALALLSNTSGVRNTATGVNALKANQTGSYNTAVGTNALYFNTEGSGNTATGFAALYKNTTGGNNTAVGIRALSSNSSGPANTAVGVSALFSNTMGNNNTGIGNSALASNTTGSNNTAIGSGTLPNNTGSGNIALGQGAGFAVTTADDVICIGDFGANVSDSCFIGNIRGVTTVNANAIPVLIDSNNQLGTMSSSRRFKKEIKPMDQTSEAIHALQPVMFHYKSDKTGTPQFGLIAEEVAEVNPDLVVHDENGEIYTVRYDAVNAMLLNEFLKEHRKVEELETAVAQQRRDF